MSHLSVQEIPGREDEVHYTLVCHSWRQYHHSARKGRNHEKDSQSETGDEFTQSRSRDNWSAVTARVLGRRKFQTADGDRTGTPGPHRTGTPGPQHRQRIPQDKNGGKPGLEDQPGLERRRGYSQTHDAGRKYSEKIHT